MVFCLHVSRSYLRRLQEQAAAAASQQENVKNGHAHDAVSPTTSVHGGSSPIQQPSIPHSAGSPFLESSMNHLSPTSNGPIPPSRYPIAADTYHPHYPGMHDLRNSLTRHQSDSSIPSTRPLVTRTSTGLMDTQSLRSPSDALNTYPLYNWSSAYKQQQSMPVPPPNALPPLSYYYRPHRLEDVAPRETIMLIISLFFDFVYPLTPCVHKPSFMADLHGRREERDPLFFALVMSTCASTLVQVPRSYLPMERPAVRKLAQICHEASRFITVASYDPPTSMHVVIRYLCVFNFWLEVIHRTSSFLFPVTQYIIFARVMMLRLTPALGKQRI